MNNVNLFSVLNAAKATNSVVDVNGSTFNPAHHPCMGVVPVKAVKVLGTIMYIGYIAVYNDATNDVNKVINVYAEDFVYTIDNDALYGTTDEYVTAVVDSNDYDKVADAVANNNLKIRVVRG